MQSKILLVSSLITALSLGSAVPDVRLSRFQNERTEEYLVKSLPEFPAELPEMYSGSLPIFGNQNRSLFFVFQPAAHEAVDEVTIWLNGGPGCSSLEGFFQENWQYTWEPGTISPRLNPYAWTNLTNVLWVDQPVGTGFSVGKINATNELDIAEDFLSFFEGFQDLFGIKNFKIYISGESYAGRYVSYLSAAMLNRKNKTHFDLSGALLYDPCIGSHEYVQKEITAIPFAKRNQVILNINSSRLADWEEMSQKCGFSKYYEDYFAFPPSKVQPPMYWDWNKPSVNKCDLYGKLGAEVSKHNPCFDSNDISEFCPNRWDPLFQGFGTRGYFNRADVKKALHAPNIRFLPCGLKVVFKGSGGPESEGDLSPDPIQHVLPQVIDSTNRVLISNGDFDYTIITEGTLLSIQNMTWGGKLGFQKKPSTPLDIQGQGNMGIQHHERGLMWVETFTAGHQQPRYQPRVSYRHLEWVLGRTDSL